MNPMIVIESVNATIRRAWEGGLSTFPWDRYGAFELVRVGGERNYQGLMTRLVPPSGVEDADTKVVGILPDRDATMRVIVSKQ